MGLGALPAALVLWITYKDSQLQQREEVNVPRGEFALIGAMFAYV
jgi:hypothetical protein